MQTAPRCGVVLTKFCGSQHGLREFLCGLRLYGSSTYDWNLTGLCVCHGNGQYSKLSPSHFWKNRLNPLFFNTGDMLNSASLSSKGSVSAHLHTRDHEATFHDTGAKSDETLSALEKKPSQSVFEKLNSDKKKRFCEQTKKWRKNNVIDDFYLVAAHCRNKNVFALRSFLKCKKLNDHRGRDTKTTVLENKHRCLCWKSEYSWATIQCFFFVGAPQMGTFHGEGCKKGCLRQLLGETPSFFSDSRGRWISWAIRNAGDITRRYSLLSSKCLLPRLTTVPTRYRGRNKKK